MKAEVLKGHLDLLCSLRFRGGRARVRHCRNDAYASGGTFKLPDGTLYPALHRLERAGLLASRWSEATGRRRRVYQLTAKGERTLAKQHAEWRDLRAPFTPSSGARHDIRRR